MKKLKSLITVLLTWLTLMEGQALQRHWTVSDGLPTGEVQQIVELPNGQMLVNCEGVFCLSNGAGFDMADCNYGRTYQLPVYANGYGQLWQGDTLLWLHDFYRIFLFDARTRAFRYDIEARLSDSRLRMFARGDSQSHAPTAYQQRCIDSLGLGRSYSTVAQDRQGGLWIGTRSNGIVYLSPRKTCVEMLGGSHRLIGIARSTTDAQGRIWRCKAEGVECEQDGKSTLYHTGNVAGLPYNRTTFIQQLPDGRYLLCDSLSTLGYFLPAEQRFHPLNEKIAQLQAYRHFVGACPVDQRWVAVYSQNGAFMLDILADTLAPFPGGKQIEQYSTKYNCMVKDSEGTLWVGTQNGLFATRGDAPAARRIVGLRNDCIRSLVLDAQGRLWAGTSAGVSCVTPAVVNLGPEDGIATATMMERAACLTDDGRLVFAAGGASGLAFHPDSILCSGRPMPVVLTAVSINGSTTGADDLRLSHWQNYLTFRFSTLDYAAPSHNSYRYRLRPMEEQWNTVSGGNGQGTANYTALPPGDYRFEVQAATADGQWGETATLDVSISPPLWLAWWAKLCYAIAAAAALLTAARLYLKRRRQKMERDNEERVNQLFELRDKAQHQFAQTAHIDTEKIAGSEEQELVQRLHKAIADNMDNVDYTVDQLARDVAMSRASLYKKTSVMLGITPNDFLRNMRLKHAARLLAETEIPVSQVSLAVGFQTPRYFSQCFRQMFGMTPTEYRSGGDKTRLETNS